jgi:hypothetical protein
MIYISDILLFMKKKKSFIKRKIETIMRKIDLWKQKLLDAQNECLHVNHEKQHRGSTGNYDPSADCY